MTDNYIQLNKGETIKLGIRTVDGKETGEYLEFDLDDLELPLRYQEMLEKDKKNREWARNQITIIERRQDVKGKKLFSKNQEDEIKVINEFFKKEVEVYDMFLGKDGVKKLLNGRKLGWTTLDEIDEIIEKYIEPHLKNTRINIENKIKEKYKKATQRNNEILK
jgi:hypothetical protein